MTTSENDFIITYKKKKGNYQVLYNKDDDGEVYRVSGFNGKNYSMVINPNIVYSKVVRYFIKVFSFYFY